MPSKRLLFRMASAFALPSIALAQSHSGFPVDIFSGPAPQPVTANERIHLLYELHLTNFAPLPIQLKAIDVFGDGVPALASYRGQKLEKALIPVEELSSAESPSGFAGTRLLSDGHAAVIFFDLTLEPDARPPKELHHRFLFSVTRKNGEVIERTVDGVIVGVVQEPCPVLSAPLRGSAWVAFNALGAKDHRRSLNAFDGKERIPQRFAIDWMRLGPDGSLFHSDSKSNSHSYGYGAEVLAVANGRVSDLKDGLPDNVGSNDRSGRSITFENVFGNM